MKKLSFLLILIILMLPLSACNKETKDSKQNENKNSKPATTDTTIVKETEINTEESTAEPTTPDIHSEYYIEGVSVDDVITYFNEVCLDAEFIYSGDPSLLQKWNSEIKYIIHGNYTDEDLQTLNNFVNWLNTIEGFPGIKETTMTYEANMNIYFCDEQKMIEIMGNDMTDLDGRVTFWYDNDIIYDATICYRTDIEQYTRNSVILEEIYNGLGPLQDTALREDSIIFSGFSTPQQLTEIDELILKLLYHPDMKCGMNKEDCEQVIRNLYY